MTWLATYKRTVAVYRADCRNWLCLWNSPTTVSEEYTRCEAEHHATTEGHTVKVYRFDPA